MSTLTEIEVALPSLTTNELVKLDDALEATLRERRKVFTGLDAVRWWGERERMADAEVEAFAADVEAARREANRPPAEPRWE
jgi:hypothetical protein